MNPFIKCLAAIASLIVLSSAAIAQPVVLKFASFESPQAPFTAKVFAQWAEDVTKDSNGALKVEMFTGGTLGRNPLQQFKLVQDGIADLVWMVPGYTPGRFDDTEIVELPAIVNNSFEGSMVLTRMAARNELVGFADLKLVFLGNVPPVSIHGKFPLRTLADLKGKRMRVGSSVGAKMAESLGAVPVIIGAPATTEAIARGVVDGTFAEWIFIRAFKIEEVVSSHLVLPLGGTAVMVPMLKSKYDSLPPAARAVIDRHSGEAFVKRFAAVADIAQTEIPAEVAQRGKNTVITADAATRAAFAAATKPVADEWRQAKPRNERVYQTFTAELARVRAGK